MTLNRKVSQGKTKVLVVVLAGLWLAMEFDTPRHYPANCHFLLLLYILHEMSNTQFQLIEFLEITTVIQPHLIIMTD